MSASAAFTAPHVADRLRGRVEAPWEVYGERLQRFELHLTGDRIEMIRAPVALEGYGIRIFRPFEGQMGVGSVASSDLSPEGIDATVASATETARFARFPTRRVELPGTATRPPPSVATTDPVLWERPLETIESFVHALLAPLQGRSGISASFGSVRATLADVTLANSEGLQRHVPRTEVELEFALKASGGPEGAPPGEYWINRHSRGLPTEGIAAEVDRWCQFAQDVRRPERVATGPTNIVLSPSVLADVLPPIIGFRLGGAAELRKLAPAAGDAVADPSVSVWDDGLYPGAVGTSPFDDEGVPQARRGLIEAGLATGKSYDLLHAGALSQSVTGNGRRTEAQYSSWYRFATSPSPGSTTLVLRGTDGGSDEELCEAAGEGIWVDQLGYAFPDSLSGAFGGEIRVAYRIRGGRRAEPVRGGTVGGVVFAAPGEPSLLNSLRRVGRTNALTGGLVTGPCLIEEMTVAGD
jgi:predicted Zn-dependent protease